MPKSAPRSTVVPMPPRTEQLVAVGLAEGAQEPGGAAGLDLVIGIAHRAGDLERPGSPTSWTGAPTVQPRSHSPPPRRRAAWSRSRHRRRNTVLSKITSPPMAAEPPQPSGPSPGGCHRHRNPGVAPQAGLAARRRRRSGPCIPGRCGVRGPRPEVRPARGQALQALGDEVLHAGGVHPARRPGPGRAGQPRPGRR